MKRNAIIKNMQHSQAEMSNKFTPTIAFAVVVMGVLLSVFATLKVLDNIQIAGIVVLGICYIFLGIYGFSISAVAPDIRIQWAYFAGQILLGGALILLCKGSGISPLLFIPLVGQSVLLLAPRTMIIANGVIVTIYIFVIRYFSSDWQSLFSSLPWYLAAHLFVIIFIQMLKDEDQAHAENERLLAELGEANKNLIAYAEKVETLTVSRERNRIAREIHDGVGHYLTVIHMQVQAVRAVMDTNPQKAHDMLERSMMQTQEALKEIRKSVSLLRESDEDDLLLQERIHKLVDNIPNDTVHHEVKIIGETFPLTPQLEQALFRAVQEGLQNCIKHSQAKNIWVVLDYGQKSKVCLKICDDGLGAVQAINGFGLISLKERMRLLNGVFYAGNLPEGGFELYIEVPV